MPIIGFNYTEISVKREKPLSKDLKIDQNLGIIKVEDHNIPLSGKNASIVKIDFEFSINYQPGIGIIMLKGDILYTAEEKKLKEIKDTWKKDSRLPEEIMGLIINSIMAKCNIKALGLSQEVNLPPHMRMPIVGPAPKPKKQSKTKAK